MATGDQSDISSRLQALVPHGWFANGVSPIRDALLAGFSNALASVYALLAYVRLQTRIATATDGFLDMVAGDFFGTTLTRSVNQTDASFRARIIANLLRERATRASLRKVLQQITGQTPVIIEPQNPGDCGGYGAPNCGYAVGGRYGSILLPFQCFVVAYRQANTGIPYVGGYGSSVSAYTTPSRAEYASLGFVQGQVTDADIYSAIDSVKPVATVIWTAIKTP